MFEGVGGTLAEAWDGLLDPGVHLPDRIAWPQDDLMRLAFQPRGAGHQHGHNRRKDVAHVIVVGIAHAVLFGVPAQKTYHHFGLPIAGAEGSGKPVLLL